MKYFVNIETLEDLKKQYYALMLRWHPDKQGGCSETAKAINIEYEMLFETVKNKHRNKDDVIYESYHSTDETPEDFMNIINELLKHRGLIVEVCGLFIWVSGETKTHKEILKQLNFKYSSNKIAWYLTYKGYRKRSNDIWDMDRIRDSFGSKVYSNNEDSTFYAGVRV